MKVWTTQHKGLIYRFEFFETTGEVCISKDGKHTYTIHYIRRSKLWTCDCPAGRHHDFCWHRLALAQILSQPTIDEPWAQWAEEASRMRMRQ